MAGGTPEPPEGTRDLSARTREPGGGLNVLVGGGGEERSTGGSAWELSEEGGIPGVTCPMRGPTTRDVSEGRSIDGLDESRGRDESKGNEPKADCRPPEGAPLVASGRGDDLLLSWFRALEKSEPRWAAISSGLSSTY